MPTYVFVCEKCDKRFDWILSISEYGKKNFRFPGCGSTKAKQQIISFQIKASKLNLKGVAIYRHGSKHPQVLEPGAGEEPFHYSHAAECDPCGHGV